MLLRICQVFAVIYAKHIALRYGKVIPEWYDDYTIGLLSYHYTIIP